MPDLLHTVTRIIRNSLALLAVSILAKGAGLIIAIIVARYLGPEALGIYAVVMVITMILEIVSPMGLQDLIVRTVARNPSGAVRAWFEGMATTVPTTLVLAVLLVAASQLLELPERAEMALTFVAIGLPFAGLSQVAQATLQGVERMSLLTGATFVGRVVSLVILVVMLERGHDLYAAFVGRIAFHGVTFFILANAIYGLRRRPEQAPRGTVDPARLLRALREAFPFAVQRLLNEGTQRAHLLILPLLVSMTTVGLFDAADRIRQTIAALITVVVMAVLPAFSREFESGSGVAGPLVAGAVKFVLLLMLPLALLITVTSPQIIGLLYGGQYQASVPVLEILIWSQVLVAGDFILKQAMIAAGRERAMLWRSTVSLAVQLALVVVLGQSYGMLGIAIAIVASNAFALALDYSFVAYKVTTIPITDTLIRPLLCGICAGAVALALNGWHVILTVAAMGLSYLAALVLFRVLSEQEFSMLRRLPVLLLSRGK